MHFFQTVSALYSQVEPSFSFVTAQVLVFWSIAAFEQSTYMDSVSTDNHITLKLSSILQSDGRGDRVNINHLTRCSQFHGDAPPVIGCSPRLERVVEMNSMYEQPFLVHGFSTVRISFQMLLTCCHNLFGSLKSRELSRLPA